MRFCVARTSNHAAHVDGKLVIENSHESATHLGGQRPFPSFTQIGSGMVAWKKATEQTQTATHSSGGHSGVTDVAALLTSKRTTFWMTSSRLSASRSESRRNRRDSSGPWNRLQLRSLSADTCSAQVFVDHQNLTQIWYDFPSACFAQVLHSLGHMLGPAPQPTALGSSLRDNGDILRATLWLLYSVLVFSSS